MGSFGYLLEHPSDPELDQARKLRWLTPDEAAVPCASWWATDLFKDTNEWLGNRVDDHSVQTFEQKMLGHTADKPTSVMTNLEVNFEGLKTKVDGQMNREKVQVTPKELARWAPGMRTQIVEALSKFYKNNTETCTLKPMIRYKKKTVPREGHEPPAAPVQGPIPVVDYAEIVREGAPDEEEGFKIENPSGLTNGEILWLKHCADGHMLYSSKCPHCSDGAKRGRRHFRVSDKDREVNVLAIDLAGPFIAGKNQERYMFISAFRFRPQEDVRDDAVVPDVTVGPNFDERIDESSLIQWTREDRNVKHISAHKQAIRRTLV